MQAICLNEIKLNLINPIINPSHKVSITKTLILAKKIYKIKTKLMFSNKSVIKIPFKNPPHH